MNSRACSETSPLRRDVLEHYPSMFLICFFLVASFMIGANATAQPASEQALAVAPRELLIMKAGVETLWGSSIVAVINKGTAAKYFSFVVNIPKESVNFQPAEGVESKEISLGEGGGVVVQKSFATGVNVVGVAFNVDGKSGQAGLTFKAPRNIPELIVMTPSGILKLESPQLKFTQSEAQQGEKYDIYALQYPIAVGTEIKIVVQGIPRGRSNLWLIGGSFAAMLICISAFLAWKTRPLLDGHIETGEFV